MVAYNKFQPFVEAVAEKGHDLGNDVLKLMLTNSDVSSTFSVSSDVTEIAAGNGYVAGGITLTVVSSLQIGGTYKLTIADQSLSAVGGPIAPFQRLVFYNSTAPGPGALISWYDFGATVNVNAGGSFAVDFDDTNGVLQIT